MANEDIFASVYGEILNRVGKTERVRLGVMRARDFRRFAVAAGDSNPLFLDDAFARAEGYRAAIAPPLYLSAVLGWGTGPPEESLRPDGTSGVEVVALPLGGLRLMGGGQELEFHQEIIDGTEVTMEVSVSEVALKEGRSGKLIVVGLLRRYFDRDGALLVTCKESFIAR